MNKLKKFMGGVLVSTPFWLVVIGFSLKFSFLEAFLRSLGIFIVAICIAFLVIKGVELLS